MTLPAIPQKTLLLGISALAVVGLLAFVLFSREETPPERQVEQLKVQLDELRASKDEEIASLKNRLAEAETRADNESKKRIDQGNQAEIDVKDAKEEGKREGSKNTWLSAIVAIILALAFGMLLGAGARRRLEHQSAEND